ncbi:MAG TPA: hypothetical protein VN867_05530 [Candidatus Binataceae bacterium]|nr:hypothetical protein [Candidatus Binataceae bacterium]
MASLLSALSDNEKAELLHDIYYLNMRELREFCDANEIPYWIHFEADDGRAIKSRDADRKGIVIDRVLHFLNTSIVKPRTLFPKSVVSMKPNARAPTETDRILYGQYKNRDSRTLELLKNLTDGKFEVGAIAQEVIRDSWTRKHAPTYREFAQLWMRASIDHNTPNPEWAYLSDLAKGTADSNWKKLREKKAGAVILLLRKITAQSKRIDSSIQASEKR